MVKCYPFPKCQSPRPRVTLDLRCTTCPDIKERKRRGSGPVEARPPSKKSRTCSQVLHLALGDRSSIHARPVQPTPYVPKQITAVIADLLTQKSISPLHNNANDSSLPPHSDLPLKKLRPLTARLQDWKAIPGMSSWVLQTIE